MKRSTLLAIVCGCGIVGAGLWITRDTLGRAWWSWQSERPVDATWAGEGCEDPGTAKVFRAVVQLDELVCAPDQWLGWLESGLTRTGAVSWADSVRYEPGSSARLRFRLALAMSRSVGSLEPELATLLDHPDVPLGEREWTRRWLATLNELPGWADPVVAHGVSVQRFVDGELPPEQWLVTLRASRVAPGAVPRDLLRPSIDQTTALLASADPVEAVAPCETLTDACWVALIQGTERVVMADANGADGAGRFVVEPPRSEPTMVDALVRAQAGLDDSRVETTRRWIHALAEWSAAADPSIVQAGHWLDGGQGTASTSVGQVIGARAGGPWTRALVALAVAELRHADWSVSAGQMPHHVRVSGVDGALWRCEPPAVDAEFAGVSHGRVLAAAAAEALETALMQGDEAAALRLAGLAERVDAERFGGLALAVRRAEAEVPLSEVGARMGRTEQGGDRFVPWVEALRQPEADPCQAVSLFQPG